jgi:hypothetical protein
MFISADEIPNHNLLIHFSTGYLPFREGFYNKVIMLWEKIFSIHGVHNVETGGYREGDFTDLF